MRCKFRLQSLLETAFTLRIELVQSCFVFAVVIAGLFTFPFSIQFVLLLVIVVEFVRFIVGPLKK